MFPYKIFEMLQIITRHMPNGNKLETEIALTCKPAWCDISLETVPQLLHYHFLNLNIKTTKAKLFS